jgi:hypothetical protein
MPELTDFGQSSDRRIPGTDQNEARKELPQIDKGKPGGKYDWGSQDSDVQQSLPESVQKNRDGSYTEASTQVQYDSNHNEDIREVKSHKYDDVKQKSFRGEHAPSKNKKYIQPAGGSPNASLDIARITPRDVIQSRVQPQFHSRDFHSKSGRKQPTSDPDGVQIPHLKQRLQKAIDNTYDSYNASSNGDIEFNSSASSSGQHHSKQNSSRQESRDSDVMSNNMEEEVSEDIHADDADVKNIRNGDASESNLFHAEHGTIKEDEEEENDSEIVITEAENQDEIVNTEAENQDEIIDTEADAGNEAANADLAGLGDLYADRRRISANN